MKSGKDSGEETHIKICERTEKKTHHQLVELAEMLWRERVRPDKGLSGAGEGSQ